MTVKELIKQLKEYNQEAEVEIVDCFKKSDCLFSVGIESLGFSKSDDCTIKNCKNVYILSMSFEESVIHYCSNPNIVNKYKKYGTYNRQKQ